MRNANPRLSKLHREGRVFGIVAVTAVTISLLSVGAQLLSVAAPIWKSGPVAATLLNVIAQLVLSAPAVFYACGLIRARHVLRRIGDGEIFSQDNSHCLVVIGISVLSGAVWSMIVAGLAPTNQYQYHDHAVRAIRFVAPDIALAALGLALIMIGRVMNAAVDL